MLSLFLFSLFSSQGTRRFSAPLQSVPVPLLLRKNAFGEAVFTTSVVGSSGLEPPTSRLSGVRSNHLSYEPISLVPRRLVSRPVFACFLWLSPPAQPVVEMNRFELSTPACKAGALPTELHPRVHFRPASLPFFSTVVKVLRPLRDRGAFKIKQQYSNQLTFDPREGFPLRLTLNVNFVPVSRNIVSIERR